MSGSSPSMSMTRHEVFPPYRLYRSPEHGHDPRTP